MKFIKYFRKYFTKILLMQFQNPRDKETMNVQNIIRHKFRYHQTEQNLHLPFTTRCTVHRFWILSIFFKLIVIRLPIFKLKHTVQLVYRFAMGRLNPRYSAVPGPQNTAVQLQHRLTASIIYTQVYTIRSLLLPDVFFFLYFLTRCVGIQCAHYECCLITLRLHTKSFGGNDAISDPRSNIQVLYHADSLGLAGDAPPSKSIEFLIPLCATDYPSK